MYHSIVLSLIIKPFQSKWETEESSVSLPQQSLFWDLFCGFLQLLGFLKYSLLYSSCGKVQQTEKNKIKKLVMKIDTKKLLKSTLSSF